ncbi:MAG: sodium-translocating pyrophosphatase [Candidatus Eisenbacteria bacterium]|uniref:Putative K(+)-stimulated pyrophosphate-energized sodium pump n=1 Tax=Eiseniibacteriota bacterium TaxID=2212470 RepID=A0A948RRG0_UNCEI|nr:sodium-translocating pyrophosphatase [Candidatus Eisenbacteria bacterium]MBU2689643.1 sodium-translocating pyrophosphatase [Candidatus Eisenbacteria bacterium]
MPTAVIVALLMGLVSLAAAWGIARWKVLSKDPGTPRMVEISDAIYEGAMAFLGREYKTLLIFIAAMALIISVGIKSNTLAGLGWRTAIAYLAGAGCSMLAGFVGMSVATRANTRTAHAAQESFNKALNVAFPGGAVMGFSVVGLGLLGLSALFLIFGHSLGLQNAASIITGFSLGASSIALFARVGGGIFTKAADVGADLVGKVEAGIPEDDPRNPAVIADNVGDNVGDVAGMGADLFESYVGAIISALVIAFAVDAYRPFAGSIIGYAMSLVSVGIVASLLGLLFVRVKEDGDATAALRNGTLGAAFLFMLGGLAVTLIFFPRIGEVSGLRYFFSSVCGLVAGTIVGLVAEYYTTGKRIEGIAESSQTGSATNIIHGFGLGMRSTVLPIFILSIAILVAYHLGGTLGIALAAIGMLAITGMTVSVDAYGPIADNAGGIAEMAHLGPEIRKRTDSLDAAGNTTAAIAKGFAIGSAALTALALFTAYVKGVKVVTGFNLEMNIMDIPVLVGLFLGGVTPFLFAADTMAAVGRAAFKVINEVRRQFREIPGLKDGDPSARAEYAKCVDITTAGALKEMIRPGTLAVIIPIAVGAILGMETLGGFLAGALISGVPLALLLANSGGAWDNAKKYIEAGHFGGKGSDAHKAAVVGDTVGDPFKDTSGPAMNILLKLMAIVSLVFTPLIWSIHKLVAGLF